MLSLRISDLPVDVINVISTHLTTDELLNLGSCDQTTYKLVDVTTNGKLAREIFRIKPSAVSQFIADQAMPIYLGTLTVTALFCEGLKSTVSSISGSFIGLVTYTILLTAASLFTTDVADAIAMGAGIISGLLNDKAYKHIKKWQETGQAAVIPPILLGIFAGSTVGVYLNNGDKNTLFPPALSLTVSNIGTRYDEPKNLEKNIAGLVIGVAYGSAYSVSKNSPLNPITISSAIGLGLFAHNRYVTQCHEKRRINKNELKLHDNKVLKFR